MRIVVAPDSFKGCLSAVQVCEAVAAGLLKVLPDCEVVAVPMADGGEGTVQALVAATGGTLMTATVEGPLRETVEATFGVLGDGSTAVIEMAVASGLPLVPPHLRDPERTSTFGTGQLIRAALDRGCRSLIVGVGGSATNDAGAGMAQALGAIFFDAQGDAIPRVTGGLLRQVARIDVSGLDPRLREATVRVACDVDNPLFGERGAAYVYGPQKGATPEMVQRLDAGLRHFAARLQEDLGVDVAAVPGAGAAGGLAAGLMAFCGATLQPGVDLVMEAARLRDRMEGADLVITGEGKFDSQTAFGKTPTGVARVARELGIPVIGLGGSVDLPADALCPTYLDALVSILSSPLTVDQAMDPARTREMLAFTAEQVLRLVCLGVGRNP